MSIVFESDYHKALIRQVSENPARFYLDKCIYTDGNGVGALGYPSLFCPAYTNQSQPQKSRVAFQPSSVQCKAGNLCLSNEGTLIVYYGRHGDSYDTPLCYASVSPSLSFARANIVRNQTNDVVCVSPVKGEDPSTQIPPLLDVFIENPYKTYYPGDVDATLLEDNCLGSTIVLARPNFSESGVDIPDDFNTGQVTGGTSYACHSLTAVVKMPKSWTVPEVVFPSRGDVQTYSRTTFKFTDVVGQFATKNIRTIAEDGDYAWYQIDAVMVTPGALREGGHLYYHQYLPYFVLWSPGGGRFSIYDMLWTVRLFDSIKTNAT